MSTGGRAPSLRQFKGNPPEIIVTDKVDNEAEVAATKLLLESYSKDGVFHCPRCGVVITDPKLAIEHLADEINKSMASLPAILASEKPGGK